VEVRAREDIAVTSDVVISGERPELEERAPDTADLRAHDTGLLLTVDGSVVRPVATEVDVVVGEVVIETEVAAVRDRVTLVTSDTVSEEGSRVVDGSLATVSPVVVLIDAEVAVALTVAVSSVAVELAEELAESVTSGLEVDGAERVVDPTRGGRLVVGDEVEGVASNSGVLNASSVGLVAVEVGARSAATSAVEVGVVEHATAIVVLSLRVADSGHVAADVAPVPVNTAVVAASVHIEIDATRALAGSEVEDGPETRVAEAVEDVAHVVRALTVLALATVALGSLGEGNEAVGGVIEGRAVDGLLIGIAEGNRARRALGVVGLATVAGILVAVGPARLAIDAALTGVRLAGEADALTLVLDTNEDVVLLSPGLAAVVTAASVGLRIGDPRAVETVNDGGSLTGSVQGSGGLPVLTLLDSVVHGELATVLPVTVVVTAEVVVASGGDGGVRSEGDDTTGVALGELDVDRGEGAAGSVTVSDDVDTSATNLNTSVTPRPVNDEAVDGVVGLDVL